MQIATVTAGNSMQQERILHEKWRSRTIRIRSTNQAELEVIYHDDILVYLDIEVHHDLPIHHMRHDVLVSQIQIYCGNTTTGKLIL